MNSFVTLRGSDILQSYGSEDYVRGKSWSFFASKVSVFDLISNTLLAYYNLFPKKPEMEMDRYKYVVQRR